MPLVSILQTNPTFVLLFSQPRFALDPAQGLPGTLGPLGEKGVQLLPPPLPLPESLTLLLPGNSAYEALG